MSRLSESLKRLELAVNELFESGNESSSFSNIVRLSLRMMRKLAADLEGRMGYKVMVAPAKTTEGEGRTAMILRYPATLASKPSNVKPKELGAEVVQLFKREYGIHFGPPKSKKSRNFFTTRWISSDYKGMKIAVEELFLIGEVAQIEDTPVANINIMAWPADSIFQPYGS